MRANTSRSRRLAFDQVVDEYDRARLRFRGAPVVDVLEHAGLGAGSRVLEVGAGTGQLTDALLAANLDVVALEPGGHLAARLREREAAYGDRSRVVECFFEDYEPDAEPFDAVVSANAFHWVDPDVSYAIAAAIVRAGGALALLWNFPIVTDPALQRRLNRDVYVDVLAGQARDPDGYRGGLDEIVAAGRAEIEADGSFRVVWWQWYEERRVLSAEEYTSLAVSLADGVDRRALLVERVHAALGPEATVELSDHIYASIAVRSL